MREVAISVDTFGGVVTLTGALENEKQRERDGHRRKCLGVRRVNNLLMIKE